MDQTRLEGRFIHGKALDMIARQFADDLVALLPKMRRFARGLTRDGADGDDLCQATIERALRSAEQWQQGTRLDAWVYRIMRNVWIDENRARARRGPVLPPDDAAFEVADASAEGIEAHVELGNVGRALEKLPDDQREAVLLVLVEGFAYKEAAEIIGCPQGTLTSRLVRGREALMRHLGETP